MAKQRLFRFNLAALLMLVTAIALFLGYAQWRRQSILREAEALETRGFTFFGTTQQQSGSGPEFPSRPRSRSTAMMPIR